MADQDFGLFAVESAQIAPLIGKLDGYPTEDHQLSLQTTEHPVESGGSVTDNAVKLPDKLRLEGWVSDGLPAAGTDDATTPDQRRAETWQTIVTLMEQRELLEVVTLLKTYQNMIITSARTELNDKTARGLRVTLELSEIIHVGTTATRFSAGRVSGPATDRTSTVDGGTKATVPAGLPKAHGS